MHSATLFSAVMALGAARFAAAQTCSKDIEISEPTPVIDCEVVDAAITVKEDVAGELVISGPKQLKGDLIINNASSLISIGSDTINSIGGRFALTELNSLNAIKFGSLESLNELSMIKLNRLSDVTFGTEGITEATTVTITDTFIDDLSGLKLNTVETLQIDNNRRLTKFNSQLQNITTTLIINNNGNDMEIDMPDLESATEIQIANVKSFKVPKLAMVEASLKLDKNPNLESFAAPNLTKVTDAVSFINNGKLGNISLPLLKEISGDLTVVNCTSLKGIDGFPKLETVLGGINLGGNFEKVELPALEKVEGSVSVKSSTDIEDFCGFFDDAKKKDTIQGESECSSNADDAIEGGDTTGDGGDSDSDKDDKDAAGIVSVNTALLGLVAMAGIAQLL